MAPPSLLNRTKRKIRRFLTVARRLNHTGRLLQDYVTGRQATKVVYLVEDANWSIKWDGIHITKRVSRENIVADIDTDPSFYANRILHFGSANVFFNCGDAAIGSANRIILTFFHGDYGSSDAMDAQIDFVLNRKEHIDALIVSNTIMQERFLNWGMPAEKIHLIPLGVEVEKFQPSEDFDRMDARRKMGIPDDAFLIGSFQKDGSGWGEGLTPKLIKGPDVFVEAAAGLAKERSVYCLLSGPARGFVKKGLEQHSIPYKHSFFDNPDDVADLFRLLDAYLVTSREEGGPKAILESMAAGAPLITTKVGMAPEIIRDRENGFLVDVGDVSAIVSAMRDMSETPELADKIRDRAHREVVQFDWDQIAQQYADLYRKVSS